MITLILLLTSTSLILSQNTPLTNLSTPLLSACSALLQSRTNYTFHYNIINITAAIPILNLTLSIINLDTSSILNTPANGKSGIYLGIGFGKTVMQDVDAIMCMYIWNNKTTDAFNCVDMYFDAGKNPVKTNET